MSQEGEKIAEFFTKHKGEINGLHRDKYWRNGGWNGLMDAIGDIMKRYKFRYDSDVLDSDEWEHIVKQELGG